MSRNCYERGYESRNPLRIPIGRYTWAVGVPPNVRVTPTSEVLMYQQNRELEFKRMTEGSASWA